MAAPVPPRLVAAVRLGRRRVVAVWRRRQGEGEGDDRLAGSVKQLDLAALEVLSPREGVDPSRSCQGNRVWCVRWVKHVGLAAGEARV